MYISYLIYLEQKTSGWKCDIIHRLEHIHACVPLLALVWSYWKYDTVITHRYEPEEVQRFAHDTHIAIILSITGCLRFSLKMDVEMKTSRSDWLNCLKREFIQLSRVFNMFCCEIA